MNKLKVTTSVNVGFRHGLWHYGGYEQSNSQWYYNLPSPKKQGDRQSKHLPEQLHNPKAPIFGSIRNEAYTLSIKINMNQYRNSPCE